jgi:anti-sigma B factor antagonist
MEEDTILMKLKTRTVKVHQVPQIVTPFQERAFLRKLHSDLEAERPRFVLDCSNVGDMSLATIRLLLSCLEVAMKRNGDVRLATLSESAAASIRLAGVDRLFEIYPSTEDAIQSFHERPASSVPQPATDEKFGTNSRYAA